MDDEMKEVEVAPDWVVVNPDSSVDIKSSLVQNSSDSETESDGISIISESLNQPNTDDDVDADVGEPHIIKEVEEKSGLLTSKCELEHCLNEQIEQLSESELRLLNADLDSDGISVISERESTPELPKSDLEKDNESIEDITYNNILPDTPPIETVLSSTNENLKKYLKNSIIVGSIILAISVLAGHFLDTGTETGNIKNGKNEDNDIINANDDLTSIFNYCLDKQQKQSGVFVEASVLKCVKKTVSKFERNNRKIPFKTNDYLNMQEKLLEFREKELRNEDRFTELEQNSENSLSESAKEKRDKYKAKKYKNRNKSKADYYIEISDVKSDFVNINDLAPIIRKDKKHKKPKGNNKKIYESQEQFEERKHKNNKKHRANSNTLKEREYLEETNKDEDYLNGQHRKDFKSSKEIKSKEKYYERKYKKSSEHKTNDLGNDWLINYDPNTKKYEFIEKNKTKHEHLYMLTDGLPLRGWLAKYYYNRDSARKDMRTKNFGPKNKAKWYFERMKNRYNIRNRY